MCCFFFSRNQFDSNFHGLQNKWLGSLSILQAMQALGVLAQVHCENGAIIGEVMELCSIAPCFMESIFLETVWNSLLRRHGSWRPFVLSTWRFGSWSYEQFWIDNFSANSKYNNNSERAFWPIKLIVLYIFNELWVKVLPSRLLKLKTKV